jgi:peptidoglycan/LPS O-acetylase OafA/YrhL
MSLGMNSNKRDLVSGTGNGQLASESANLDILRACAVLLVFVSHFISISKSLGAKWSVLWHLGQLGVLIFFVHTCLVLMCSLERSELQGVRLFASFYIRRVWRIYPLSIIFVLIAYCLDARWSPVNLWQSLTLMQYIWFKDAPVFPPTVGTLWTLPLEIEMYVALPFLFLAFRNRSPYLLGLFWAISVPMAWFQPRLGEGFALLRYVPCFLGGVIAWRLMRTRNRRRFPGWMWPAAIAAIALIWMMSSEITLPFCIAAFGLCLGLAIPLFHEIQSPRVANAGKIIARYSYGIYLSHFPIMVYVLSGRSPTPRFKLIPPMPEIRHFAQPIHAVLVLTLTAGASYLLYHGVEKPGIELGRKIAQLLARSRSSVGQEGPLGIQLVRERR